MKREKTKRQNECLVTWELVDACLRY